MGVTLAHQVTADIPSRLLSVITGNVGTMITMQISAEDAPFFTKELQIKDDQGKARPDFLQNQSIGQAFVRTPSLKKGVPISVNMVFPPEKRNVPAYIQDMKKTAKLNFGKREPEAEIAEPESVLVAPVSSANHKPNGLASAPLSAETPPTAPAPNVREDDEF